MEGVADDDSISTSSEDGDEEYNPNSSPAISKKRSSTCTHAMIA
jgi:hypothetical protein